MKQPYGLAPDDRADESVRKILHRLFGELRSKVDGIVEDADVEFLHDLRVANRRTRTAVSQIKGVLPASVVETFQPEFKWLGDLTGSCRDLDVFLTDLNSHRQRSPALGPLKDFLREKRQREHALVCDALRSEKFQRLIDNWGRFLETGPEKETEAPFASSPIIEVAGPRILKSFRRMRKRGTGIEGDPPAALLHRLRIDGKKLRYLLEFFIDLYPVTTVSRFIGKLKQLQDILGDFNDTGVQLALIGEFVDHGTASEDALAATENLVEEVTDHERELLSEFSERFALFASDESRKLYKRTFKAV
ncbi:CHAD domain-containing protein [Acidobacteriota bacterium]